MPAAKFAVHQCAQLSADPKLPRDQAVKIILNYLKGTSKNGIIMNPDPKKGIECYVDADSVGGWNQEEGRYPSSVLYISVYLIMYSTCPIIWAIWLQTEIELSIIESRYIALSQAMRGVLPFMSLMKEIFFIIELEYDIPKVKSSIFENPAIVHEENQGTIALAVAPQM